MRKIFFLLALIVLFILAFFRFGSWDLIRTVFMRAAPEGIVDQFISLYHSERKIPWDTTWWGLSITQTPTDMWSIQEIVYETRPDIIIETGTYRGGSALYFAFLLKCLGKGGRVISVDINPQIAGAQERALFNEMVEVIKGNSVSSEVLERIREQLPGKKVLVTLDSDHRMNHVLKELEMYSEFVTINSYIIVQDTFLNGHPVLPKYGNGPMEAVNKFIKNTDKFIIDRSREKYLLTFYPKGYLKRVK